ncbi:MAG: cupin domain-containing protein [Thermodesulfobacteriota bacterium]|nr:cupin domain-containing protein [Thermodesulfobacteriota bacterium]
MSIPPKNLFQDIPSHLPEEMVEVISESNNVRIERIVSKGDSSPDGFWYDQEKNEFVILLKGRAKLLFEGEPETVTMKPGDYIEIKAHVKHRVDWTDPKKETVWLAIHYSD